MEDARSVEEEAGEFRDWRGRAADAEKHGGKVAAAIACVVEMMENLVFLAIANNFVSYFIKSMHYPSAKSATMVLNFLATSFLLALFGGFVADSLLTRFTTFALFCSVELLGLTVLTIQAQSARLQPPLGRTPSQSQAAILFTGLYVTAAGIGGVKATLPAHGGDQLSHRGQRVVSSYFNWYFFSLCTGGFLSATVMVWIQDNKGWNWSFEISIAVLALALCIFLAGFPIYRFKRPAGSPFTRIFRVFVSAIRNRNKSLVAVDINHVENGTSDRTKEARSKFRCLDRAVNDGSVTSSEVAETKAFLGLLPIFGSTIMMNCCLAQLQTFSVEQGMLMNRKLSHDFEIPTQSLVVIPLIVMLSWIFLYEACSQRLNNKLGLFRPLRRIGLGLTLASLSMAVAATVELKRRLAAKREEMISVFWLSFQYLFLAVSDLLTLGGMLEFFYSEAPVNMRSMSTSLSWCSMAMGYFLSSVLVEVTDAVSGRLGKEWIGERGLNNGHLDLFYTLLCVLNTLNLVNYIFWARRYR